jgi:Spy/CpxP family protein refolding chaperone
MAPGAATMPPLPPPFAGVPFTEAQRKAVSEMMAKEREAHRKRIALMQQQEARLHELYQADVWDSEAITAAYEAIFAQQRKTIEAMAKARNRIHGMLSAEQRAQMSRLQHQRMERFAPPPQSR